MKTSDLKRAVESGTFDQTLIVPSDVNPSEIFSISDIEFLRKLAAVRSAFAFLSNTETWKHDQNRQFLLGLMDRLNAFLEEIANGACRCIKYKYKSSCDPDHEERAGVITISEKRLDGPFFCYECVCTTCNTHFSVTQQEERFVYTNLWRRKAATEMSINQGK
jgi:hypothetical protein